MCYLAGGREGGRESNDTRTQICDTGRRGRRKEKREEGGEEGQKDGCTREGGQSKQNEGGGWGGRPLLFLRVGAERPEMV